jgi:hypothetical protein
MPEPRLPHQVPIQGLLPHEAVPVWGSKRGDQRKKLDPPKDNAKEREGAFLETTGCLMIFGRAAAYDSKHHQKLTRHEVYVVEPATPAFL